METTKLENIIYGMRRYYPLSDFSIKEISQYFTEQYLPKHHLLTHPCSKDNYVYFIEKAVNKVKFINDVDGVLYPMRQIPDEQKNLKGFKWWESRRPKNKLELFE